MSKMIYKLWAADRNLDLNHFNIFTMHALLKFPGKPKLSSLLFVYTDTWTITHLKIVWETKPCQLTVIFKKLHGIDTFQVN